MKTHNNLYTNNTFGAQSQSQFVQIPFDSPKHHKYHHTNLIFLKSPIEDQRFFLLSSSPSCCPEVFFFFLSFFFFFLSFFFFFFSSPAAAHFSFLFSPDSAVSVSNSLCVPPTLPCDF
ncbi:hypothetical protein ACOSQ3_021305 [Xanthoceras sorbifolium]